MGTLERKTFTLNLKQADAEQGIIEGYAAVFSNVDEQGDIILPGAFKRTIEDRGLSDIDVFIGHDWHSLPVGEPLSISEDEHGLFTRTKANETTGGRDVLAYVKGLAASRNGKRLGMSIGYEVREAAYEERDGQEVRLLKDVELFEYSYVAMPANPLARVTAVKAREGKGAIPSHSTATDTESAWNGSAAVREATASASVLRYMHAWRDPDGDADVKQTYKFPHHNGRGPAIIRGVNNALARLANADVDDKPGVERHLRRHRRDAGLEEAMSDADFELAIKDVLAEIRSERQSDPEMRIAAAKVWLARLGERSVATGASIGG